MEANITTLKHVLMEYKHDYRNIPLDTADQKDIVSKLLAGIVSKLGHQSSRQDKLREVLANLVKFTKSATDKSFTADFLNAWHREYLNKNIHTKGTKKLPLIVKQLEAILVDLAKNATATATAAATPAATPTTTPAATPAAKVSTALTSSAVADANRKKLLELEAKIADANKQRLSELEAKVAEAADAAVLLVFGKQRLRYDEYIELLMTMGVSETLASTIAAEIRFIRDDIKADLQNTDMISSIVTAVLSSTDPNLRTNDSSLTRIIREKSSAAIGRKKVASETENKLSIREKQGKMLTNNIKNSRSFKQRQKTRNYDIVTGFGLQITREQEKADAIKMNLIAAEHRESARRIADLIKQGIDIDTIAAFNTTAAIDATAAVDSTAIAIDTIAAIGTIAVDTAEDYSTATAEDYSTATAVDSTAEDSTATAEDYSTATAVDSTAEDSTAATAEDSTAATAEDSTATAVAELEAVNIISTDLITASIDPIDSAESPTALDADLTDRQIAIDDKFNDAQIEVSNLISAIKNHFIRINPGGDRQYSLVVGHSLVIIQHLTRFKMFQGQSRFEMFQGQSRELGVAGGHSMKKLIYIYRDDVELFVRHIVKLSRHMDIILSESFALIGPNIDVYNYLPSCTSSAEIIRHLVDIFEYISPQLSDSSTSEDISNIFNSMKVDV